ncbi:MAG TPA: amidohydrolase family protein [Dehalococcoidia bacterium]|nr:amidohydrolase family protein [Dehalococcoidia bacterium]
MPQRPQALHLRGVILPDGAERDIFVSSGRLTFQPVADARTVLDGGFILPGLVDMHAHLAIASPAGDDASAEERVRASAGRQLAAGVLALREPGSPDRASRELGPQAGLPRVFTAGRFLAPPGRYFPGIAREVTEEQLPAAAADEARASGAWVKVIGDFPDPAEGRMHLNFPAQALTEAARRAHAAGARIAIHATSEAAITGAVEAGFDSIEHGQGIREDHLKAMAERGIAFVPTLTILPQLPDVMPSLGLGGTELALMLSAVERHPQMAARAAEAGVLVLAGTDAGMGPHGMVAGEIELLARAGLPLETALAGGSWAARRYLGLPGIEEGAPADLVAYADDPRDRLSTLSRPLLRILDGLLLNGR